MLFPLFLIASLLLGCHREDKTIGQKHDAAPVSVIVIDPKDTPVSFSYIAQTQSSNLVNIQARVNGFLDKQVYQEGEMVKEGDVLFIMDMKPFVTQVNAAKASLAREEASLHNATQNLHRVKPLTELNALSQKDLDDAQGAFETASASVEMAKAEVEKALLNLSYCTITAPLDGITGAAIQQEGSYINVMQSQLTTVSAISPIWVNFSISENQMESFYGQVSKNTLTPPKDGKYVVKITLVDGTPFPNTGEITFQEPYFNPQTGTFLIRASVENPQGRLRSNQFVHATVEGAIRPNAILVPQKAVMESAKGYFVWVIDNEDKASFRPVILGDWHGPDWFVIDGIQKGDRVAVDGVINLHPGASVKVVKSL